MCELWYKGVPTKTPIQNLHHLRMSLVLTAFMLLSSFIAAVK